jgi:ATP-binding cassette, subfamily B, fatty acid transporter
MSNMLLAGKASAQRVFELLDAPRQNANTLRAARPATQATSVHDSNPTCVGRVEFDGVTFGYRPGAPVLKDLSLLIEPGSTVAIVGPTGAGKTTLVNLLLRFYDVDCGRIMVDGRDITTFDHQSLRSQIGIVLQDTWVFAGAIADNIGYGRPGASRGEIIEAARATKVDEFVRLLPEGYDTLINEDSSNLSVGQKQLITIARVFLASPKILILDEATGSVDTRTEVQIRRALAELRRDRTCIVIAHRLSMTRDADVIVLLDEGRIVEQGSHTRLLAARGAYHAMIQAMTVDGSMDDQSRSS